MEPGSYNPLNLDATFFLLGDVGYVRHTHTMLSFIFSIKKIKFPLDNVVLGNIFQVKQIFLLDKIGCSTHLNVIWKGSEWAICKVPPTDIETREWGGF